MGGLLGKLTKMVLEGALEGEMDDHLGYAKHDPEGRNRGNSRNGRRAKTVLTGRQRSELLNADNVEVPEDRRPVAQRGQPFREGRRHRQA